jgi:dTDP-4-dehydrorhamnose 3,5-epimerase
MIDGVTMRPLAQYHDERGKIMKMLERTDEGFGGFGEIYFSVVDPGVVKGWHWHEANTLNYACVSGMIKFVLYDDREGSPTRGDVDEIFMGPENYALVTVPPRVWNGFKGIAGTPSIVADCTTQTHAEDVMRRLDPHGADIPYDWARRDG